jgi:DNA-directed RNA polymerase alpha subunit
MSDTVLERIADALERIAAALEPPVGKTSPPGDGPTLAELKLTTRTRNALSHANDYYDRPPPNTLSEIAKYSRAELLRIENFGHVCYLEVWLLCVEYGYWKADDPTLAPEARVMRRVEEAERARKWRPPRSTAA